MKVILLKDIGGVGRKGEVKNAAEGYAQNFLLPRKLAIVATAKEIKQLNIEKTKDEEKKKIQEDLLEKNLEALRDKKITIQAKASEAGHLFAGIHKEDIVKALKDQASIEIPEENLDLKENIKSIGSYKIPVVFKNNLPAGEAGRGEFELEIIKE